MDETVKIEHTVSVRDALLKLQTRDANVSPGRPSPSPSPSPSLSPSPSPSRDFGNSLRVAGYKPATAAVDDISTSKKPENDANNFVRAGSVRQKLTQLNGASQDWRTRVRSENDSVQFTADYKMRTRNDRNVPAPASTAASEDATKRPAPLLDHSTSCTEPNVRILVEEHEPAMEDKVASSESSLPCQGQDEQEGNKETVAQYRLRMRPRRNHAASRAQKCATVCEPEKSNDEQQSTPVCKQQSVANLSVEVDRPDDTVQHADVHFNRAERAVKNALSTKIDFEQETARRKRTSNEPRREDKDKDNEIENATSSIFGTPCLLRNDSDWCALLVKGKRRVQVRVVAPLTTAFSSGDSYVVVTRGHVFVLLGTFSNVLERARATDVAKLITTRKELGYANADEPNALVIEQHDLPSANAAAFWTAVGTTPHELVEPVDDDEAFEAACFRETTVLEIESFGSQSTKTQLRLRPLAADEVNASQLSSSLLDSRKALLLMFGTTEMYTWFGKHFDFRLRSAALRLASSYVRELVAQRPFALLAKVNEGAEPSLFVRKFAEWLRRDGPASSIHVQRAESDRVRVKRTDSERSDERAEPPRLRLDEKLLTRLVQTRLTAEQPCSTLVLNGEELRRGATWTEIQDEGVIRRMHDIKTLAVKQWLVDAKTMQLTLVRTAISDEDTDEDTHVDANASPSDAVLFHFCEQNSYVVRWQFKLDGRIVTQRCGLSWPHGQMLPSAAERREGVRSRHNSNASDGEPSGRVCSAYFLWHGFAATSQTRTAAAYLLCGLDSEKSPHCVVEQFREPPAFLRLLNSARPPNGRAENAAVFQHLGLDSCKLHVQPNANTNARLYVLRHDFAEERVFVEVPMKSSEQLHEDACYLLVTFDGQSLSRTATVHVWHARSSTLEQPLAQFMLQLANSLVVQAAKQVFADASTICPSVQPVATWLQFVQVVQSASNYSPPSVDHTHMTLSYDPMSRLRLFRFLFTTSSTPDEFSPLQFDLVEQHAPLRRDEYATAKHEPRFPFTLHDLHDPNRQSDTVVLLDAFQRCVFLWFADPPGDVQTTAEIEASVGALWNEHLRAAVQTALIYCDQVAATQTNGVVPSGYLLFSGFEPAAFRKLFPFWKDEQFAAARRVSGALLCVGADSVGDCFALDLRTAYKSLFDRQHAAVELRKRRQDCSSIGGETKAEAESERSLPLRISVDSRYLEAYLSDADFQNEFKMSRDQFYALPRWRQTALKKDLNLY